MASFAMRQSAFDAPRLRAVAEYLREHISDPNRLSLRRASRIVNVCPAHFSRFFHERAGICFHDWQAAFRMERARQLLLEDRLKIGAVGLAVGYVDPSTFGRVFKRYEGMTPRQLVKLVRAYPEFKPVLCTTQLPKLVFQVSALSPKLVSFLRLVTRRLEHLGV